MALRLAANTPWRNEAFAAALLSDLGIVALVMNGAEWRSDRDESSEYRCAHERSVFGVTHAETGAHLLGLWNMSWSIVDALATHHAPDRFRRIARSSRPSPMLRRLSRAMNTRRTGSYLRTDSAKRSSRFVTASPGEPVTCA